MDKGNTVDQVKLAESISEHIKIDFVDDYLVKPLDPVKVKKEFSTPVSNQKPKTDKDGIEAVDYDEVKTEIKEVDSDFRKGRVLKIPMLAAMQTDSGSLYNKLNIQVGDVIIFKEHPVTYFDLIKDSRLVKVYHIVGIER